MAGGFLSSVSVSSTGTAVSDLLLALILLTV